MVTEELVEVKNKFADPRRTEISDDVGNMSGDFKKLLKLQDLKKEDVICLIDNESKIKIIYQSRIMNIAEETVHMVYTNNQDKIIVITDIGELVIQRLKDLPSHTPKSDPLDPVKFWNLKGKVVLCETMEDDYDYLCMLSNDNTLKKIKKDLLLSFKKFPTVIMALEKNERITSVVPTKDNEHLGIISKQGQLLLFSEGELRPM